MKKTLLFSLLLVLIGTSLPRLGHAQEAANDIFAADDDDLNVGGDIFTDFSEDVETAKVVEDERFYRYGRFFSFNASLGLTTFDGNRGIAYENQPPSFGISFTFFKDFQTALGLGLEFSKHSMFFNDPTGGFQSPPGLVEVSMLRVFLAYRYYIETANLGTAITYSNPYLIGRMEYWYETNKFADQTQLPKDVGGGLGFGLGFGLEFPIELKESYIGLEFLVHSVNFPDKNTQKFTSKNGGYGFANLGGNAYSTMVSYVFNW
ncbi:MAG: hypothetical protein ACXVLQ_06745 [Bacteriovorax sp.]